MASGGREGLIAGTVGVLAVVPAIGIALAPPSLPVLAVVCFGVYGIGLAAVDIRLWALEADTVEYGEWKTGVRTEARTCAAFSPIRKLGQAVGGAVATYAIGLGGHVAGAEVRSQGAVDGSATPRASSRRCSTSSRPGSWRSTR